MANIDLLNRVQSPDGWLTVLGLKGKSAIQELVQTREEFDKYVAEFLKKGRDVYFGVAKFETNLNRKKENVKDLKSFWIDLDCGESKAEVNSKTGRPDGYIDQPTGLQELQKFCKLIGLPKPLLVNSGRGIHAYWPLTNPVSKEEWEPVANRLNELCVLHNLYVDASVFEIARVLRVPGTLNFKDNPPKPVELISDAPDVEYETFKNLLGVKEAPTKPSAPKELSELQKAMAANTVSRFSKIMIRSANNEGCAQLLYQYQNQDSVSEPMWFNALSIAHRCVDRETAIHKISERHPEYSPEDTENKASHTAFAQRCATFEKNNPGGCDGCQWKGRIGSPIALGREIVKAEETEVHETEELDDFATHKIPSYPHPYFRGKNGGIYITVSSDEETEPICVYEHDLYVVKRMNDPDPSVGELVLLRLHLPQDGVREFTIPLSTVAVKERLREALSTKGVAGMPKQMDQLMAFLMTFIKELQYKKKAELMRTQFGWVDKDSKFIIGDREINKDGVFHSPPSTVTQQFAESMHPMGTFEKWKEVFNMYGAPGLEPHAFAALTAFGAPLLKFTGHSGAIINLIHKDSGTGKSTALYMCNSVYGHPDKLAAIWKDTLAAKVLHLGIMNNLPFTVDEITNLTPADFSTLAYSMSQGRGANRSRSDKNEMRINKTTWQTMSLASSNASFYEKMGVHKNSPDGEMMRLLEYQIHPSNIIPTHVAKHMFDHQLKENYGHAGDIYCSYLVNNLEDAKSNMLAIQQKIDKEMRLTNKERFWSAVIACNLTGGLIARMLGLHDYDMKAIYAWSMQMLTTVRQDIAPPANNSSSVIGDYINRHIQNMLVVNNETDKRTNMHTLPIQEPRDKLYIRYEPDTKLMYIVAKHFKKDCVESQASYKDTLHELKTKGIFLKGDTKQMSKGMRVTSPGVYALIFDCSVADFIDIDAMVAPIVENASRED
jgi:hypothetical protein